METASYIGLFAELEKIAEKRRKDITRAKFKRHLLAAGAVFTGAGLGHLAGGPATAAIWKKKGRVAEFLKKHPKIMKYAPVAVGAAAAGTGAGVALRTKKHLDYVGKADDRPK